MKKFPATIYFVLLFGLTALNFALRYLDLPNYFFIAGFRFYIVVFLAGIFLLFYQGSERFKLLLHSFSIKKICKLVFPILLPPIIIIGLLFFLKKIELGDPDYFYELGLSSIVDFPIYLVWNFPQFFMLYTLLQTVEHSFKLKIIPNFVLLVSLFSAELFTFPQFSFNLFSVAGYAIILLTISLFVYKKSSNFIAFIFYAFTLIWFGLLLFGSHSETLLQIFLAKTYTNWDGFFEINKKFIPFVLSAYFLLSGLLMLFFKKEKTKE